MSGRIRYSEEFKREAVAQVTDRGHSVTSVATRIGVSSKSLYAWVRLFGNEPIPNPALIPVGTREYHQIYGI